MYAAIRQGKAKAGMAEELARRIKEGAIPIISDVPSFHYRELVILAKPHINTREGPLSRVKGCRA